MEEVLKTLEIRLANMPNDNQIEGWYKKGQKDELKEIINYIKSKINKEY